MKMKMRKIKRRVRRMKAQRGRFRKVSKIIISKASIRKARMKRRSKSGWKRGRSLKKREKRLIYKGEARLVGRCCLVLFTHK
jgi:hypothetical protein